MRPVDLVRDQPQIVILGELRDRLDGLPRIDRACGVVGRIDQQNLCLRRDCRIQRLALWLEIILGPRLNDAEIQPGAAKRSRIDRIIGCDHDAVPAGIGHRLHRREQRALPAGRRNHLGCARRNTGRAFAGACHCFAQMRQAGKISVVVMACAQRRDRGFDRWLRRSEIMIAHRQHDDVCAGPLALQCLEMHFPSAFPGFEDTRYAIGQLWHGIHGCWSWSVDDGRLLRLLLPHRHGIDQVEQYLWVERVPPSAFFSAVQPDQHDGQALLGWFEARR